VRYFVKSIGTFSFWRYALFSLDALAKLLAVIGAIYLFMELMDFLKIYTRDEYGQFAIFPIVLVSIAYVVITRRPIARTKYKPPQKDYIIEVKIGDIFAQAGDVVISTSTTFDTDISSGLISAESLQGQLALKVFDGNTAAIDEQLDKELQNVQYAVRSDAPGKNRDYPIGTVAKVATPGKNYFFVAMSRLSASGTASSTPRQIEESLESLWHYVAAHGELRTIVIPLIGTGRGRIELPRKKIIERIAQSFADAMREKVFSNKLTIVVHPADAENFGVNLFEVRDYLVKSLHT
jgi:hypothetical protein